MRLSRAGNQFAAWETRLRRGTAFLKIDELRVKVFDLAAEIFVAGDHLVGILALKVELRVVHSEAKFGAGTFLFVD